jgi:dienelactone hydrolase
MKIWYLSTPIRVFTLSGALLLVACSSVGNPAPVAPADTAVSTALPATASNLSVSATNVITATAATATALPPAFDYEESVHLFDYDQTKPLDVQEISVEDHEGVAVHDITFAAYDPEYGYPAKGRMSAYLVTPPGRGPFAGVVFMHWLGEHNSNRNEFVEEAIALAHKGVASLLVEGLFPWHKAPSGYEADKIQIINQVIELRRALDVLLSQPEVDPQRIGYVGHDYGAMFGAILAGVDHRAKAYVLMAGMGNFSDWSLKYWPVTGSKGADAYRQAMVTLDPIGYIPHAAPATLYFQFAKHDKYISEATAMQFYDAGSDPKEIRWYETAHALNTDEDIRDRSAWLSSQLGLKD